MKIHNLIFATISTSGCRHADRAGQIGSRFGHASAIS
jgi:hypothetical protein